jgi:uncharacterized protein (TIGR03435 family)
LEFLDPRFPKFQKESELPINSPPDIFRAVQEQLGLQLEGKKAPVEVLVIDHVGETERELAPVSLLIFSRR